MADNRRIIGYGLILNVFFLLTIRDLLVHTKSDEVEEPDKKPTLPEPKIMQMRSTGPLVKFLFWKVFEQYRSALTERFPGLGVEGGNFDPPLWRVQTSTILSYAKIAFIFLIALGYNPFQGLGTQTPRLFEWAMSNRVYACLMAWFLTGMLENSLMSTGAFEVFYNDVPVWSKLESGRLPEFPEIVSIISQQKSF